MMPSLLLHAPPGPCASGGGEGGKRTGSGRAPESTHIKDRFSADAEEEEEGLFKGKAVNEVDTEGDAGQGFTEPLALVVHVSTHAC